MLAYLATSGAVDTPEDGGALAAGRTFGLASIFFFATTYFVEVQCEANPHSLCLGHDTIAQEPTWPNLIMAGIVVLLVTVSFRVLPLG